MSIGDEFNWQLN